MQDEELAQLPSFEAKLKADLTSAEAHLAALRALAPVQARCQALRAGDLPAANARVAELQAEADALGKRLADAREGAGRADHELQVLEAWNWSRSKASSESEETRITRLCQRLAKACRLLAAGAFCRILEIQLHHAGPACGGLPDGLHIIQCVSIKCCCMLFAQALVCMLIGS